MRYDIRGEVLQTVDVWLDEGEQVFCESGGMCWMSPNVEMSTGADGGLLKSLGRMFSGESFFLNTFTCTEGEGLIAFCNEFPGKIVPWELGPGESIICQKDAFMAAEKGVEMSVHFQKKLGAGFFGGEGFILQKLTGPGTVWLELAGEVTEYELKERQTLKLDQGHLGAMEPSVDFDLTRVKGVKNVLFGGEGLFLASVMGPGKVWLQSMPLANLAAKLHSRMPSD